MRCEKCNKQIKIRTNFQTQSEKYKEWISHNGGVQKTGFGSFFCWQHYKKELEKYGGNN